MNEVTVTFIIDDSMSHTEFMKNLGRMFPTTTMVHVPEKPKIRTIDKMKAILDGQLSSDQWSKINAEIRSMHVPGDPELNSLVDISCKDQQVLFSFDSTGERFLGICNWKG